MENWHIIDNHQVQLDVVEHKRSFAGHTIYRVVLKAFKNGRTEPAFHVFVWRRYNEIKKLHKELKQVSSQSCEDGSLFPEFIKAKIFGRFEEHIIEERKQSAASFFSYVASRPQLYKTNAFKNFFEGAVKGSLHHAQFVTNDAPIFLETHNFSLQTDGSNLQADNAEDSVEIELEQAMTNPQPPTWSNRQPTPELLNDGNIAGNIEYIEPVLEIENLEQNEVNCLTADITKIEIDNEGCLSASSHLQTDTEEDIDEENDVFGEGEAYNEDGGQWLRKAFSVCSEGDDIEKLASEAGDSLDLEPGKHPIVTLGEEIDSARSRCSVEDENGCGIRDLSYCGESKVVLSHSESGEDEREVVEISGKEVANGHSDILHEETKVDRNTEINVEVDNYNYKDEKDLPANKKAGGKEDRESPSQTLMMNSSELMTTGAELTFLDTAKVNDFQNERTVSESHDHQNDIPSPATFSIKTPCSNAKIVNSPDVSCGLPFSFDEKMTKQIQEMIKNDDYIYHASLAMSEAIDHEEQKKFESSFEMYKLGIGLLLEGVKKEKNEQRRQAVRRKTAQYLLRAESLHRKHLLESKKAWHSPSQAISLAEVKSIGVVDKVILVQLRNSEVFAMKVLHKCGSDYKNIKISKTSRDRRFVGSKYMVKVCYHTENSTGIYLLLEYIPTGLLWNYLDPEWKLDSLNPFGDKACVNSLKDGRTDLSSADEIPPEDLIRIWAAEILMTLENLHKSGIICRDLNPRNILLDETGHIKLTHFSNLKGVEYCINESAVHKSYAAPECRGMFEPTKAADWWSLGAILFELLTGKSLYSCYPDGIHSHSIIHLPRPVSNEAWSLLAGLLRYNPKDRLGAGVAGCEEIMSHPFFTSIDWNKIDKAPKNY